MSARTLSRLVDTNEAARLLGTTPRHIRELWARRELAAVKVGRLVRFSEAGLADYVERHTVGAV